MDPFQLLGALLWGVLIVSAAQTLRFVNKYQGEEFGFSALAFVSWLSIFSYLAGFSIGLVTAAINIGLCLIFSLIHKSYRLHVLFVMAVNILLVSFMRGFIPEARIGLEVLLGIGLLLSLFSIYTSRKRADEKSLSLWCLSFVAILFLLSVEVNVSISFRLLLCLLPFLAGIGSFIVSKHHKWHLAILMVSSLLLTWVVYLQISAGV